MKKLKKLLPAFIAVALAFVMVFAVACNGSCGGNGGNGGNGETTETLTSIAVDYSSAKTQYVIGEEFSSEGLVVTAKVEVDGATQDKNVPLTDSNLTVDSSAYKNDTAGQYTINVSYTLNGVTKTANYTVSVKDGLKGPGLKVSLATGVEDTIELSESEKAATIDLTKIVVEVVSATGETMDTLTADQYTAELYKDDQKLDETSGLGGGVYQIWATAKTAYAYDENWNPSNFVLVYVVNNLTTLTWDSEAAGTLTEQTASSTDSISSTWKFTAAYANGDTKDVTEDVVLSGVETKTAGENKTATATYTEANAKGEEISKTADVTYTINQAGGAQTYHYSLDIAALQAAIAEDKGSAAADKDPLKASYFTGNNGFLTLLDGNTKSDQYRTSNNGIIEIKGDRLSVTFQGTGTITVSFASTGGENESRFGLKKAGGAYVEASETTATKVNDGDDAGTYSVTGTSYVTVTYTITEAGTYTLCSPSGVTTRGCRISAITMHDVVGSSSTTEHRDSLSISELQAAIAADKGSEVADKDPLKASYFTGSNGFLTLLDGNTKSDQYRTSNSGIIEIKGDRLSVTFQGTGTITVSFASTGGENESHFGLKKADGTYVEASETTATKVNDGDDLGTYSVTGTSYVTVTFTITEAGTYTLCSPSGVTTRGCRISSIVMVDNY